MKCLNLPTDATERNEYPLWDGLFGYFASALCEIARLSKVANEQHNPGEPMHWAREKSTNHRDKIIKHLLDSGPAHAPIFDTDGTLHSIKVAWRALAFAQTQLEALGRPYPENGVPQKANGAQILGAEIPDGWKHPVHPEFLTPPPVTLSPSNEAAMKFVRETSFCDALDSTCQKLCGHFAGHSGDHKFD